MLANLAIDFYYCEADVDLFPQGLGSESYYSVNYDGPSGAAANVLPCPLPFVPQDPGAKSPSLVWNISIANDNRTFSRSVELFLFDAKCLNCSARNCTLKVSWMYLRLWAMKRRVPGVLPRNNDWLQNVCESDEWATICKANRISQNYGMLAVSHTSVTLWHQQRQLWICDLSACVLILVGLLITKKFIFVQWWRVL